jgi:hexosaminidase
VSELFPDEYVHVGGDENNGNEWKQNSSIQSFMKAQGLADSPALQAYFAQRVQEILQRHGKKMLVWEEDRIAPRGALLETWHRGSNVGQAVRQGRETLLSTPYYLDQIQPASRLYQAEPLPSDLKLTPEQEKLVLGGEACMWGEHVSPETIDSRIWPMLGAVAERLWSHGDTDNVSDMYRRLDMLSARLEDFGLTHIAHTDVLLRSRAQTGDINFLQEFLDLLRPATFDQREASQHVDQFTPLTGLVDAANPDPPYVRRVNGWADAILSDAPHFAAKRSELEAAFQRWRDLSVQVEKLTETSPWLQHARTRDVARLADIGSEALALLGTGKAPPAGWKQAKLAWLNEAEKPKALLRFAVLSPIRQLVVAAGESSAAIPNVPEWRARIAAEALASAPKDEGYR